MADVNAATITVKVSTNASSATGDLKQLDRQIDKTGNSSKDLDGKSKSAGNSLMKLGNLAKLAAVGGMVALAAGMKKAAQAGSDLEESTNKFKVVFKSVSKEAFDMADNLRESYGMSRRAALDALSGTGDLLTGFGFTADAALDLSNKVAMLGTDLASFNNYAGGTEGAINALTKGLLGETESMKALGIVIRQDTDDFKAHVAQLQKTEGMTRQQAKAQAIYEEAIKQSANSIGDFERSTGSLAHSMKIINARAEDFWSSAGAKMNIAINDLASGAANAGSNFESFGDTIGTVVGGAIIGLRMFILKVGELGFSFKKQMLEIGQSTMETWAELARTVGMDETADEYAAAAFQYKKANLETTKQIIAQKRELNEASAAWDKLTGATEAAADEQTTGTQNSLEELQALREEAQEVEKESRAAHNEEIVDLERQKYEQIARYTQMGADIANEAQGIYGAYSDLRQNQMEAEIMKMEERGASEAEIEKKRKELARQAAIDQKRMAVFSTIVDTATGVTKALASTPPPYSYVLAALTATKGAVQLAAIKAQPIPAAQMGGQFTVPPGNEADTGLLRINSGEQVTVEPVRDSGQGSGGGPKNITVQIGRQEFRAYMVEEMNNILNSGELQIRRSGAIKTA
jgi:hypothetical protein